MLKKVMLHRIDDWGLEDEFILRPVADPDPTEPTMASMSSELGQAIVDAVKQAMVAAGGGVSHCLSVEGVGQGMEARKEFYAGLPQKERIRLRERLLDNLKDTLNSGDLARPRRAGRRLPPGKTGRGE